MRRINTIYTVDNHDSAMAVLLLETLRKLPDTLRNRTLSQVLAHWAATSHLIEYDQSIYVSTFKDLYDLHGDVVVQDLIDALEYRISTFSVT